MTSNFQPCRLNKPGRITDLLISNMLMSECNNNTTFDEVWQHYEAYYELVKILYSPENILDFYMKPGQISIIQNTRVLYGRTTIADSGKPSKRWLQIIYMDWDGIFLRLRVLQKKLGFKTPYRHEQSKYDAKIFIALYERTFETALQVVLYFAL